MTDRNLLDSAVDGVIHLFGTTGTWLALAIVWLAVLLIRGRRRA